MADDLEYLGNINDMGTAVAPPAPRFQFTSPSSVAAPAMPSPEPVSDDGLDYLGKVSPEDVPKPASLAKKIGRAITYPGKVLAAETQDVVERLANKVYGYQPPEGQWRNIMALDSGAKQTPYEQETSDIKGFQGIYKDVSNGIVKTLPQLYLTKGLSGVLQLAKVPATLAGSAAMGTVFGFSDEGFNPKEAAIMAAFPVVAEFGGKVAESVLGKLGIDPASQVAKQAVKWVGSLAASQAYMDATSLPTYLSKDVSPEDKRKQFVNGLAQNIAFHLIGIPGALEAGLTQEKANAAAKEYADQFWQAQESKKPAQSIDDFFKLAMDTAYGTKPVAPAAQPVPPPAAPINQVRTASVQRNVSRPLRAGMAILSARGVPDDVAQQFTQYFLTNSPVQSVGETFRSALNSAFDASGLLSPKEANTYSNEEQLRNAAKANEFTEEDVQTGIQKHADRVNEINQQNQNVLQQLLKPKEPNAIETRKEPESVSVERQGTDALRTQTETSTGDSLQRTTPVETPQPNAAEAAVANLPPVQSGYVRLYHGGIKPEEARDITPNYDYAKGYAEKGGSQARVWYVDVPENSPWLRKAYDDTGIPQKAPPAHQTAPAEVMLQAKEVPQAMVTPGGGESTKTPEQQAQSRANNSREAFEALAKTQGTELPTAETVAEFYKLMQAAGDKADRRNIESNGGSKNYVANQQILLDRAIASGDETVAAQKQKNIARAKQLYPEFGESSKPVVDQPVNNPEPVQKYKVGNNPQTWTLVEKLPQSAIEKESGEQPVTVKNDKTGKVETMLESDLTPVKTGTGEKTAKRDLDSELRTAKLDPSVFRNDAQKREALKRQKALYAIKPRQAQLPTQSIEGKGWLAPDGTYHQLTGDETHEGFARKTVGSSETKPDWRTAEGFDASEELYRRGWQRVVPYGSDEVMVNTSKGRKLSDKQLQTLKDHSIESGKKVVFDNGNTYNYVATPSESQLGESEPRIVRPTTAVGLDEIRKAFEDPRLGYDARSVQTALAILKQPVFQKLDWSKLILAVRQKLEGNAKGAAWIADNLIEMSGGADEHTFPHEIFHFLYELLPDFERSKLNELRLDELRKIYGDNIPSELRSGRITSDQWQRAGLPSNTYRLSTGSEYLAHMVSEQFDADVFKNRHANEPEGFWQNFRSDLKAWVKGIVFAVKRALRINPGLRAISDRLLAGKYEPTPEDGAAYERATAERQASLPRTPQQYEKQKGFEEPGTSERTMGAYGDVVSLKSKFADEIGAGEKARKMVMLTNQELLSGLASVDMATPRLVFGNYDAMRARTEGSDMGLRSGVIVDAFRGLGYEQARMISLREKLAAQQALVGAQSFKDKIFRMFDRKAKADTAEEIRKTYANQIAQQAGDVVRELNEKGKTEAQYEQLKNTLARLTKMKDFNEAVTQRVNDIVDVVTSTPEGFKMIEQGGDRTGTQIARAYMDIKQSIADASPKPFNKASLLDKFSREHYLSESERQRLESNLPMFDDNAKAFIQLASQVLAANADLRLKLATLAHYSIDPEFKAQVDAVGESFRKQYEKDPNNAIKQIVKTASSLKAKEINAQNSWLRLHKQVTPELQKLNDLQEAVDIDNRTVNSEQWKQLVNQIYADNSKLTPAFRIPDSEIPLITSNTVFNEFTGNQQLRSPLGGVFDVDIGFTKASVIKAQAQMNQFLDETAAWLGDPANANSPDRAYWNMRYDFVDAGLNVSTVLDPTVRYGRLIKGPLGMFEFVGESAALPAAKIAFSASNNFQRAWAVMDQWFQGAGPESRFLLQPAAKSHKLNADTQIYQYRDDVLSLIASEYRHGNAVKAGDRLISGDVVTPEDMKAFRYQGKMVNDLFQTQKNIAREKLMVDNLLVDQWAQNVFGVRAPQELGAEPGTTLPHEFSQRGQNLARQVAAIPPGDVAALTKLFDQPAIFDGFVKRFIDERRADYSTPTPFEDLYKQIAAKWRNGEADAPQNIGEMLDYLEAHSDPKKYTRQNIEATLLGEMESLNRRYHKNFVAKEDLTDTRADRATKNTAFTQGFQRDVGPSYFYDYGAVTTPEVRALGIDSTNFHLVRFVRALDGAVQAYDKALAEFPENAADRQRFIKERYPRFKAGDDFRDFSRLQDDRNNLAYFRDMMPKTYGRQQVQTIELFSKAGRFMTDAVTGALSGLGTVARVLVGSQMKMGLVMGGVKRWYIGAYPEAMISTVTSAVMMPARALVKGVIKSPELARKAVQMAREEGIVRTAARSIQVAVEGLYAQGKFFNQQYQFGLGFKAPAGFRAWNIWKQTYSHGGQYEAKFSSNALLRLPEKALYQAMSVLESPMELVRVMFPNIAYAVSYDAAARMAGSAIDGIGSQARRTFEYLEKTGGLADYDLNRPSNLQNILPANYYIPKGFFNKGETNAYQARDWWQRSIDVPLNEMVINYWRKLAATPRDQRGNVSFLASDIADPAKVKHVEETRTAALMTVPLKDVHHAATENRPIQLRQDTTLRFLMPLAGWATHSIRKTGQELGMSPRDSRHPALLYAAAASTLLGFTAYAILNGEEEKGLRKAIAEGINGEVFPEKMITESKTGTETAKMLALDSVTWMSQVHGMAASLLGESSQTVGQSAISLFPVQKIEAPFQYLKGAIATGDPGYGLAALAKQMVPFLRPWIQSMESQQGLVELKNARTIVQKFGPEQLLDKQGPAEFREPTQLTPLKQALSNAVFRGDTVEVTAASQAFVAKAVAMGQTPEQAQTLLRQAMSSINPLSIGGRKMTDAQHQEMVANLGTYEGDILKRAETNWNNANAALGFETPLVKQERGVAGAPSRAGASRLRTVGNRLRVSRGRSTGGGYRSPRMRAPRLRVNRQRYRTSSPRNRLRRRATIL